MSEERVQVLLSVYVADKEEDISLEGRAFVFGRSVKSDVYINDPCMSRSHFQFMLNGNDLWIEDLGSSNGTFINETRLESHAKAILHSGDVLTIESSTTKIVVKEIRLNGARVSLPSVPQPLKPVENEREDITSIINKIIEEAHSKAEVILSEANQVAGALAKVAKEKAIAEFSDDMKKTIAQSLEVEKNEKSQELTHWQNTEKARMEKQRDLDQKAIEETHARQKSDLLSSLVGLEDDLREKKEELSNLGLDVEKKKQKILEELDREHSERLESFKETRANQDAEIAKIKNEIAKLENLHEKKKAEQLKVIEVEIENRKNEIQAEMSEYESKVAASKKEFSKLYETYELKKTEQVTAVTALTQTKDNLVLEIKKLEDEIEKQIKFMAASGSEVANIKSSIDVLLKNKEKLTLEQESIEKLVAQDKKLVTDKKEVIQGLHLEIEAITKKKESLLPELGELNEQVKSLKLKIEATSSQSAHLEADQKQKMALLEKNHLEAKKNYQDEMVKLKESEEKRLQQQLHEEMSRVSQLKEESLRLVIDLEDSITKEISIATSKIFASTIGASKYSEIAPQFEKSIRTSLQTGVLKLLKNDLDPSSKSAGLSAAKKPWKPLLAGMTISGLAFGLLPYVYKEVQHQTDPVQQQMRLDAEQAAKALIPIPKYTPEKVKTLGSTFVNSVNHTEDFCEIYALEEFRSKLIKEGSVYLYKNWQIEEEKSIESYAIMFSMIDALKLRRESVNPEFEKRDIAKMVTLENETMKKVEKLLGNAVRVEAALKFQARFYNDFVAHRSLASGVNE